MKIGSWLGRQLTTWHTLAPGQQHEMVVLGLTPESNPLTPASRARRTFEQTKARTKHRTGQLPDEHVRLVAALFDGDWTAEDAAPAALA
ncbi:hypothetical protein ABZ904_39670 [Streptomyces sp. NPDC046900]|uniref:hypothetical protein n=1 Tax=Streptomyces sp. NPDC046900 TaxID=3155473 RepID=UPI0033D96D0A